LLQAHVEPDEARFKRLEPGLNTIHVVARAKPQSRKLLAEHLELMIGHGFTPIAIETAGPEATLSSRFSFRGGDMARGRRHGL
jgi:hypothetical protein